MHRYKVRRAAGVTLDLDLIEESLAKTYRDFGEDRESATERAAARIEDALTYMWTFETHPHRGTEHPAIRAGLRTIMSKSFVFYFEVDEARLKVRILAVFFGGADHRQQIIDRLRHSPR